MKTLEKLLSGAMAGAGAMYLLDPDRGARRRSLLRDKGTHVSRTLGEALGTATRDVQHRSAGAVAGINSRFRPDHAGDEVIQERVRTALGRVVSHPGAINTAVEDGRVFLSGPVLQSEVENLLAAVRRVRGVREVENQLQVHERGDTVPGLQGGSQAIQRRAPWRQEVWDPTTRLVAGGLGSAALARGLRSGGVFGGLLTTLGAGLLARAATNLSTRRLLGLGAGRDSVTVHKTMTVDAPVDKVWALWSSFENFPRFMRHLREVRRLDDRRSRWSAVGPAGTTIDWEAVTTAWVPNETIAWESVEGGAVATAGVVHFRPVHDGRTVIDVRLSYTPPAGAVGHAVAVLFGIDPKQSMDDDMVRLKSLLEEGKTTGGIAREQVRLEEIKNGQDVTQPW